MSCEAAPSCWPSSTFSSSWVLASCSCVMRCVTDILKSHYILFQTFSKVIIVTLYST
jgi:hypothetical protein